MELKRHYELLLMGFFFAVVAVITIIASIRQGKFYGTRRDLQRIFELFPPTFNFHIQREMMGDHWPVFRTFITLAGISVFPLILGLVFKQSILVRSGGLLCGMAWTIYGFYGMVKREIFIPMGGMTYGIGGIFSSVIYFLLGLSFMLGGFLAS